MAEQRGPRLIIAIILVDLRRHHRRDRDRAGRRRPQQDEDPEEFDRYVRWAWLSNFIHLGFLILLLVLFIMLSTV